MALDLYVGTLTRYHCGDWETIGAQMARQQGVAYQVVRPDQEEEEPLPEEQVREAVLRWRNWVASGIAIPLEWDESSDRPYFTDRPYWEGLASLLCWASHEEHPETTKPAKVVREWTEDVAYIASTQEGFETRYPHLLHNIEYWLPAEFPMTFHCDDVVGNHVNFGSSPTLLAELTSLNERTWQAREAQLQEWRFAGCDPNDSDFETAARFGFSIFLSLCKQSVENNLVLKLDY